MHTLNLGAYGAAGIVIVALGGCATVPAGPTIAVMPAPGEPMAQFQQDDYRCRQYALQQTGTTPNEAATNSVATGAIVGTALGAAAGALLGHGRAYPVTSTAAMGLLAGTAVGAGNAQSGQYQLQGRYNIAYAQCMYAAGAQVPGYAPPGYVAPPSQPGYYGQPPPPPGPPTPPNGGQ